MVEHLTLNPAELIPRVVGRYSPVVVDHAEGIVQLGQMDRTHQVDDAHPHAAGVRQLFQAAVAALVHARIGPLNQAGQWSHDFVQVRFVGELVNRRKRFPSTMRQTLITGLRLRQTADYKNERVKPIQAMRGLARAQEFVAAVVNERDR